MKVSGEERKMTAACELTLTVFPTLLGKKSDLCETVACLWWLFQTYHFCTMRQQRCHVNHALFLLCIVCATVCVLPLLMQGCGLIRRVSTTFQQKPFTPRFLDTSWVTLFSHTAHEHLIMHEKQLPLCHLRLSWEQGLGRKHQGDGVDFTSRLAPTHYRLENSAFSKRISIFVVFSYHCPPSLSPFLSL